MKNSLETLNSRFQPAEERLNELEESMTEAVKAKETKKKKEQRKRTRARGHVGLHQARQYICDGCIKREDKYLRK